MICSRVIDVKNGNVTHQPLGWVWGSRGKAANTGCAVPRSPPSRRERDILRRHGERFTAELKGNARGRVARHSPVARVGLHCPWNLRADGVDIRRWDYEESCARVHESSSGAGQGNGSTINGDSPELSDPEVIVRSIESHERAAVELGGI